MESEVQFYRRKALCHVNSARHNIELMLDSKDLTAEQTTIAKTCKAFLIAMAKQLEEQTKLNTGGFEIG